jgi:zinc protease
MPRDANPPKVTAREPAISKARHITLTEDNAPAPVAGIGWRTVPSQHDDYVPLELLASILGGGNSSRIYRDLVSDRQLAVMAMGATLSLEQEAFFGAGCVLSPLGGDTKKALAALHEHVERLRAEPVTEQELTRAKNQLLSGLITQTLTVENKASLIGGAAVLQGDVSRINRRADLIRRTSADDLKRVAGLYLTPERSMTLAVESNLLGSLLGSRSSAIKDEENAPISAPPEKTAPPPGKPGLRRPADFPSQAPVAKLIEPNGKIAHTRHKLSNGLPVLIIANQEKPYISAQLGLRNGAWTETKPGTASMTLGMLTKGTAKHTEKELAAELETHAISLSASAGMDTATVSVGCLPEHAERAMTLLGEVVTCPTFPVSEFDKLRKQVRTSLAMANADPSTKADRAIRQRVFGDHPYARTATGEPRDVDALKVEDLPEWWKAFARPEDSVLLIAGAIEPARALQLAESALGAWKAEAAKPAVRLLELPKPEPTRIYLIDHPGVQSQIRVSQLSINRDDPRFPTARVVSDYFGGAFNSRLNETIRVKKGLTYGARGGISPARFASQFTASTFSKTESTAEAVKAVLDELERMRAEAPTTTELDDTKSYQLGSFAGDRETPQQLAGQLWLIEANQLPADYYDDLLKKVATTDAEGCRKTAEEIVDPLKWSIVVVGPSARIKESLEKIAPVTVITADAKQ